MSSGEAPGDGRLAGRILRVRQSRLVRQNLILFAGGLVAGIGGFVYHAVAGRILGPALYGDVASLVAVYAVGGAVNQILILVLARYAATLRASGDESGVRYLVVRASQVLAAPAVVFVAASLVLSGPARTFLNLDTSQPVIWLALAVGAFWYTAVPRGVLQGIQHFNALSGNLSLELVVRTTMVFVLLKLGFGVSGAMVAILTGCAVAWGVGMLALRPILEVPGGRMPLRSMVGFALTAAAGTVGVLLLYNLDVILAKHFLPPHQAGIYGALNKIGTILYFLTLSVSQVLFPRVVEAVAQNNHPGRLLLMSAGIMSALGACAIAVFGVLPDLVVNVLFAAEFRDAAPYVLRIGVIGLGISLANLLVQFLMALHDRWFIPILGAGVALLVGSVTAMHGSVGEVVNDVLVTIVLLLVALSIRVLVILPSLRPEMLGEDESPA